VKEQTKLKLQKTSVAMSLASFELKAKKHQVKKDLATCIVAPKGEDGSEKASSSLRSRPVLPEAEPISSWWLGKTVPEWTSDEKPEQGKGPYWCKGKGTGLKVRCGPRYLELGYKTDSSASMYEAVCIDAIKSNMKVENIIGRLVTKFPDPPKGCGACGIEDPWSCPLPRWICINLMLPYKVGINPFVKDPDPGCSFVGFFHIKPETLKAVGNKEQPPCVKLFQKFFAGPAGIPGGHDKDKSRSLNMRVDPKKRKDQQSGLFKVTALCENAHEVKVPENFRSYNGKPCLITKCGYIVKDPGGEWLEIGIDVRGFNLLARTALAKLRNNLPLTRIHYGFLIQGVEDEELPEALLCDMHMYGINLIDDPVSINA